MRLELFIDPCIRQELPILAFRRKRRMDNRNKCNNDILVDFRPRMNGIQEIHDLVLIALFILFSYYCSVRKDTSVLPCTVKENDTAIVVQHPADLLLYCGFIVLDLGGKRNQPQCPIVWATRNTGIMIEKLAATEAFSDWKRFVMYSLK